MTNKMKIRKLSGFNYIAFWQTFWLRSPWLHQLSKYSTVKHGQRREDVDVQTYKLLVDFTEEDVG